MGPIDASIYVRIGAIVDAENEIIAQVERRHFMSLHRRAWAIQRAVRSHLSLKPLTSVTSEERKVLIE